MSKAQKAEGRRKRGEARGKKTNEKKRNNDITRTQEAS